MPKRAKAAPMPARPSPIDEERAFWQAHRAELKARYPDQFVAIRRSTGEVVAVEPDFSAALQAAKRAGFGQSEIWCRGMRTTPLNLIV